MKLIGGVLPFLGFQDFPADADGQPCFVDPDTGQTPPVKWIGSFLMFEWLGWGVTIYGSNFRPAP